MPTLKSNKLYSNAVKCFFILSILFTIVFIPFEIAEISIIDKALFYFSPIAFFLLLKLKNRTDFLRTYFTPLTLSLCFFLFSLVSLLKDPSIRSTGFTFAYFSQFLWLIFFLIIKDSSLEKACLKTVLIGFYLSSVGAALEFVSPSAPILRSNPRIANLEFASFFSNPNHFANIQLLAFSILTIAAARKIFSTNVHLLNTIIAFTTIYLSKSRSGLFFFIVFVSLSLLFTHKSELKRILLRKSRYLFIPLMIFISACPFLLTVISFNKRYYIWDACLNAFLTAPLFGIGSGKFGPDVNLYAQKVLNVPMSPHSMYWGMLSENGLLGFLMFMGLLYWAIRYNKMETQTKRIAYLALLVFLSTQFLEYHLVYYQGFSNILFYFLVALNMPSLQTKPQTIT